MLKKLLDAARVLLWGGLGFVLGIVAGFLTLVCIAVMCM